MSQQPPFPIGRHHRPLNQAKTQLLDPAICSYFNLYILPWVLYPCNLSCFSLLQGTVQFNLGLLILEDNVYIQLRAKQYTHEIPLQSLRNFTLHRFSQSSRHNTHPLQSLDIFLKCLCLVRIVLYHTLLLPQSHKVGFWKKYTYIYLQDSSDFLSFQGVKNKKTMLTYAREQTM